FFFAFRSAVAIDPFRNFVIACAGLDESFEIIALNALETEEHVIERTIEMVFADVAPKQRTAFIDRAPQNGVAAHPRFRTARRFLGLGSILNPPSRNTTIMPSWQSASEAKIRRSRSTRRRWKRKISPHRCAKLFCVSMPKCKARTTASSYFATRWRLSVHPEQSVAAVYSSRRSGRRRMTVVRYEFRQS